MLQFLLGFLAPTAVFLALLPRGLRPSDDAFISFRYAWNLIHGRGLVYNLGDRVEGFSNPLWTLLEAAGMAVGIEPTTAAAVLAAGAGVGLIYALHRASLVGAPDGIPLSPWLAATSPVLLASATTGLETLFFSALLFGGAVALEAAATRSKLPVLACSLFALATLTRPEGAAWACVLTLSAPRASSQSRLRWGAPALAAVAAFAVLATFRLLYYRALLPNTFAAKVGDPAQQFADGLGYLRGYAAGGWVPLAVAAAGLIVAPRELLRARRGFLALVGCVAVYVVVVGGDWMPQFRFLALCEPFLFVWVDGWLRPAEGGERRRLAVLSILVIVFLAGDRLVRVPPALDTLKSDSAAWDLCAGRVARWLRDNDARGVITLGDIGEVGWVNRETLSVIDLYGLVDRQIAAIPGRHMKKGGPAYLERTVGSRPEWIVLRGNRSCDDPLDVEFEQIYRDPRFQTGYRLAMRTNEDARLGWCLYRRQ